MRGSEKIKRGLRMSVETPTLHLFTVTNYRTVRQRVFIWSGQCSRFIFVQVCSKTETEGLS